MGVRKNPFTEWQILKQNSDYRNTDTQLISYVRQQLSQSEYLRSINRVNPGPWRNKRVEIANSAPTMVTVFGPEQMWGYQEWTKKVSQLLNTPLATGGLYIEYSETVPGTTYLPFNKVAGATYTSYGALSSEDIYNLDIDFPTASIKKILTTINGIPVDTEGLNKYTDNYVMIYKAQLNKFTFVAPSYVLGSADSDGNIDTIDFGTYSVDFGIF